MPLVLESAGVPRTIQVLPTEFPLYLPTPIFPPPGNVTGSQPSPMASPQLAFVHVSGPSFESIGRRHGADFVGARLAFSPQDFGRTLAKIAFGAAIYALGIAPFRNAAIRRAILGDEPSIGYWVGSWQGRPVNEPRGLHAMQVRANGSDIHVILRLFAQFGAPEYHVVLGPADPAFVASKEWPFK